MGWDMKIDPATGDYVEDGKGAWKTTTTLETAVQHQIKDHLNKWVGDPDAGSNFFLRAREQRDERTLAQIRDDLRLALKRFVDQGLAADLQSDITKDQNGRSVLVASLRDVQHGTIDLTPFTPYGA